MANYEEGKVLAIASHVVSGYVGNSVTTFILQLLGLEAAGLNTVQFSNHSGYRQLKGFRTTAEQIEEIYEGLKMNGLVQGFDMILSGYVPSEEALKAVGRIAKEVKERKGSFWLLDPVMGDQGRLYVSEAVVPVYKELLPHADLIVPNQFETELLTGITINSLTSISQAIDALHTTYGLPHVIITSITLDGGATMFCAGSTRTSTGNSRKFLFDVPVIEGFYSGTGDLFAALTLARLREFSAASGLLGQQSWIAPDDISAIDLPLAKAVGKVLGSMHLVLEKTKEMRDKVLGVTDANEAEKRGDKTRVEVARASELRLVRCMEELKNPRIGYEPVVLK